MRGERDPWTVAGAAWTAAGVLGLVVWALASGGIGGGALILLGPALGAAVALRWPRSAVAQAGAAALVAAGVTMLLIGGTGLLLLPPVAMFLVAATRASRRVLPGGQRLGEAGEAEPPPAG